MALMIINATYRLPPLAQACLYLDLRFQQQLATQNRSSATTQPNPFGMYSYNHDHNVYNTTHHDTHTSHVCTDLIWANLKTIALRFKTIGKFETGFATLGFFSVGVLVVEIARIALRLPRARACCACPLFGSISKIFLVASTSNYLRYSIRVGSDRFRLNTVCQRGTGL